MFLIKKNTWKNIGTSSLAQGKILGRLAFYTWVCPTVKQIALDKCIVRSKGTAPSKRTASIKRTVPSKCTAPRKRSALSKHTSPSKYTALSKLTAQIKRTAPSKHTALSKLTAPSKPTSPSKHTATGKPLHCHPPIELYTTLIEIIHYFLQPSPYLIIPSH